MFVSTHYLCVLTVLSAPGKGVVPTSAHLVSPLLFTSLVVLIVVNTPPPILYLPVLVLDTPPP